MVRTAVERNTKTMLSASSHIGESVIVQRMLSVCNDVHASISGYCSFGF